MSWTEQWLSLGCPRGCPYSVLNWTKWREARVPWSVQDRLGCEEDKMNTTVVMCLLLGVVVGMGQAGIMKMGARPKPWGTGVTRASRAGRLGQMSLKATLASLSMAGSMALFASIESALAPDDFVGRQWLAEQKAEYLREMNESNWYSKPWTISGAIICFLIISIGGSLGIRCSKNRKMESETKNQQEKEMLGLRIVERDVAKERIQFGEVDLELATKKDGVLNM